MRQLVSVVLFALLATTCGRAATAATKPRISGRSQGRGEYQRCARRPDPDLMDGGARFELAADGVARSNAVTDPYLVKGRHCVITSTDACLLEL